MDTRFANEPPRYPNGVPINTYGITSHNILQQAEYSATTARVDELLKGLVGIEGTYDARHLQSIHQYIFQDIYDWAGNLRSCSLSKELYVDETHIVSYFCEPKFFAEEFAALQEKAEAFALADELDAWHKQRALVDVFVLANHIHPFAEGNGRTLRVFMEQLANEQSLHFDFSAIDPGEWNLACVVSGVYGKMSAGTFQRLQPDIRPIFKIFDEILAPCEHEESCENTGDGFTP